MRHVKLCSIVIRRSGSIVRQHTFMDLDFVAVGYSLFHNNPRSNLRGLSLNLDSEGLVSLRSFYRRHKTAFAVELSKPRYFK